MAKRRALPKLTKSKAFKDVKQAVDNNSKNIDKLNEAVDAIDDNLDYFEDQLRDAFDQIEEHEKKFDRLNDRVDDATSQIKTAQKDNERKFNELHAKQKIAESATKKIGLLSKLAEKHADKVKDLEQTVRSNVSKPKAAASKDNTIAALANSMSIIASSLSSMNAALAKVANMKGAAAPSVEEVYSKSAPAASSGTTPAPQQQQGGFFSELKTLFTNPAVVAALAGIVYTVLPKDTQDKIKSFLGGFADGVNQTMGENEESGLGGFNTALKVAGVALTTYFGAKMISGIASAITSTIRIAKMIGVGAKALGGKGVAALAAGAAVGAGAYMMSKKKGEGEGEEGGGEAGGAEPVDAESKPSASGTGLKPGGGVGLKPGGGVGLKIPQMTGEDKPVMNMIKEHEGVRTRPYKDSLGLWTVGVGHLIGDGRSLPESMNREFSMSEVDAMFAQDYASHKAAAEKIPGYNKANPTGKAALIDLTFNMGPTWWKKWPNLVKSLEAGNAEGAAKSLEDSKWYAQVGNRAKKIVAMIRGGFGGAGDSTFNVASGEKGGTGENVTTGSSAGAAVNTASADVKNAGRPGTGTKVSSVDASSKGGAGGSQQPDAQPPIPSPIASRGSLGAFTRHSTAA